ncbi:hypothetical protein SAMN05421762_2958 [Pseudooceanicola nitratireducens]|uniref:Acetolactate synthase n=1 Tax=Pseudooceanicola nitratireducens TaxID=517719 RepID=A0A1I1NMD5_9RHOB|nr:DUF6497 family protein [Pseudooceanicola nitratireducens]SEI70149.1 hypothetical protein SAMN05216183_101379 [Pseudooceanicola nitratireducens]SFC96638.1 hypothetical protein SAMN05421762_2958 [Pseudooceanicola nitratireducens]
MIRSWINVAAMGVLCAAATTVRGQEGPSPVPSDSGHSNPARVEAAVIAVPSGRALSLQEVREETQPDGTLWLRLRYVAPGMTRADRAAVADDFQALCQTDALRYQPQAPVTAAQAVISIAAAPMEFGVSNPEIPQFFEAFRLENGTCIWEAF